MQSIPVIWLMEFKLSNIRKNYKMKKQRKNYLLRSVIMMLMFISGILMGSRHVEAAGTYNVVYHMSWDNASKTVVKKVRCGKSFTVLSGDKLKFFKKNKCLAAWSMRRQSTKKWALSKRNSSSWYWGSYNKKSLNYVSVGDKIRGNFKANESIHLYGYWADINNINVTDSPFGANGKDTKADDEAIQRALNVAKNTKQPIKVKIPAGTYYLSKRLKVYSNTTLKLNDRTTMKRMRRFVYGSMIQVGYGINQKTKIGKYNQARNVTIIGGKWIDDPENFYTDSPVMRFHHCSNIVLKNCTFEKFSSKHALTFVAAKDVLIDSVTFKKQKLTKGSVLYDLVKNKPKSAENAETIHTDFAGKGDGARPFDGTICDKIRISNCLFSDVYSGIGSHIRTRKKGTSYIVCKNTFKKVKYNCLNMYSRDKVEIYSNKMIDCKVFLKDRNSSFLRLEVPLEVHGIVSTILKQQ